MTVAFIFMLTHHDVTVPHALALFEKVKGTGLRCVGCKDIGLNIQHMHQLFSKMKKTKMKTFLEVVTRTGLLGLKQIQYESAVFR
jgi:hypothetical protein